MTLRYMISMPMPTLVASEQLVLYYTVIFFFYYVILIHLYG